MQLELLLKRVVKILSLAIDEEFSSTGYKGFVAELEVCKEEIESVSEKIRRRSQDVPYRELS